MSLIGISRLQAERPTARRPPRGPGLACGALVSLALWAGLIKAGLVLIGG